MQVWDIDEGHLVDCPGITLEEYFITLCGEIDRKGMSKLMEWLEKSDFYIAPASSKYHGAYEGGLLEHSINVYHEMMRLMTAYQDEITASRETILITTLFHDLCKVHFYKKEKKNRKNELGRWEEYYGYTIDESFVYGGHGSKSVFILQSFIELTTTEATAINCHMGGFSEDKQSVGRAFDHNPYAWLLSVADQSATYVIENK